MMSIAISGETLINNALTLNDAFDNHLLLFSDLSFP